MLPQSVRFQAETHARTHTRTRSGVPCIALIELPNGNGYGIPVNCMGLVHTCWLLHYVIRSAGGVLCCMRGGFYYSSMSGRSINPSVRLRPSNRWRVSNTSRTPSVERSRVETEVIPIKYN